MQPKSHAKKAESQVIIPNEPRNGADRCRSEQFVQLPAPIIIVIVVGLVLATLLVGLALIAGVTVMFL